MPTLAVKRDHDLHLIFDFISQLLDSGFYGKIILNVQNGVVKDLRTEQSIKMATLRESENKLDSDKK